MTQAQSVAIESSQINSLGVLQVAGGGTGTASGVTDFKNRIINGAMVIDQRNAGASVTPTADTYLVDRWQFNQTQVSKFSFQQNAGSVTPPTGFTNYLGATVVSAYSIGSGDIFDIRQAIEGFNISDLGWGTANAKTVTLSFQVYSSLTGTFGGVVANGATSYCYPFTYSIPVANTWTSISLTIAGPTSGTFPTNNTSGAQIRFSLGSGSTYSATAGSWQSGVYTSATGATSVVGTSGATFYITGVQLEVGSSATGFGYRPYGTELALCQRYFEKWNLNGGAYGYLGSGAGIAWASNGVRIILQYQTIKRTAPTVSATGTLTWAIAATNSSQTSFSFDGASPYGVLLYGSTIASVFTIGVALQPYIANTDTFSISFSAEL